MESYAIIQDSITGAIYKIKHHIVILRMAYLASIILLNIASHLMDKIVQLSLSQI